MRVLFTCLLSLVLSGCITTTPAYKVRSSSFENLEYGVIQSNEVTIYQDYSYLISVESTESRIPKFFDLNIIYVGTKWYFISGNVIIGADDKLIRKVDENPNRKILGGGKVTEKISIEMSESELNQMNDSNILKIQFFGEPIAIDEIGKENLARFVDEFVN